MKPEGKETKPDQLYKSNEVEKGIEEWKIAKKFPIIHVHRRKSKRFVVRQFLSNSMTHR